MEKCCSCHDSKGIGRCVNFRDLPTALSPTRYLINFGAVTTKEEACKKVRVGSKAENTTVVFRLDFAITKDWNILLGWFADEQLSEPQVSDDYCRRILFECR